MNRSQLRGDLPEPVSRYFDDVARLQPPTELLSAAIDEIERTPHANRFSPLASVAMAAAAVIAIALVISNFLPLAAMNSGADETPIPSVTPTPTSSPRPLGEGVDAFLLAEGDGPGGPWSYWVWTAPCPRAGTTALWTSVGYKAGPALATGSDLERCIGADTREQPYVVERSGTGPFLYGQTRLDVVRVRVRLVDGREFEVDTIAAPDGLDWKARFYVTLLPVDITEIDTVRGYDANGQYVPEDWETGEGAP